jgi:chemotaxis protein histidine kinase CheA
MLSGSFMLGRAGDSLYAISADAVEEAIVAPPSGADYMWKGIKLPVTSMGGSESPHAGVVVSAGGRRAVLLFEQLEGEERLYSTSIESSQSRPTGIVAAAARADGSVALIIDVSSYLPVKSATGRPGAARARKRAH